MKRGHPGGRVSGGDYNRAEDPKVGVNIALAAEVRAALDNLPQIKSKTWSRSYLVEQILRNYLGLPGDYSASDLQIIAKRQILE